MNDLTLQERLQQPDLAPKKPEETLDLVEYWRAISKRRWSILGLTLLVTILAMLIAGNMRPLFRGTATLLIEQGKSKVVSIEEIYSSGLIQREYYQTQIEILKSDELARKVVVKLNLATHPDYDVRQTPPTMWNRFVGTAVADPSQVREDEVVKRAVNRFKRSLQVGLVRNSQLAQISFSSYDQELSARVPNALAETYIESDLEARMAMTLKAAEWLRERMGELRTKVDASERALQDYRDRERIVDAKGLALSGASKQLETLSGSLVEARQKRAEAEGALALVTQIRSGRVQASYDSVPAVLRSAVVQQMKLAEADAEKRLGDASKRYGPEHPKMIQARAELESAKENTRRQVEIVVGGLTKELEQARANESAVERALAQSKSDIQGLNRKEFQLGILEREVQQNRNLYDMFVGRLKEMYIRGGYNVYPVEVEATLADHPAVAQAAVVGTPDPVLGERGTAFVVAEAGTEPPTLDALRDWCRARIADAFPVNATHKVDKAALLAAAPQQKDGT